MNEGFNDPLPEGEDFTIGNLLLFLQKAIKRDPKIAKQRVLKFFMETNECEFDCSNSTFETEWNPNGDF